MPSRGRKRATLNRQLMQRELKTTRRDERTLKKFSTKGIDEERDNHEPGARLVGENMPLIPRESATIALRSGSWPHRVSHGWSSRKKKRPTTTLRVLSVQTAMTLWAVISKTKPATTKS